MQLCFATNNEHKLTEIRQLVREKFTILSLWLEIKEFTFVSDCFQYESNAEPLAHEHN